MEIINYKNFKNRDAIHQLEIINKLNKGEARFETEEEKAKGSDVADFLMGFKK